MDNEIPKDSIQWRRLEAFAAHYLSNDPEEARFYRACAEAAEAQESDECVATCK